MFGISEKKPVTDEKLINELLDRGIENIFPSRDFLKSKMVKGERLTLYLGIDPTGPALHLGHLIPLLKLAKFQKMGHQIILLIGDFTAMVGDPTDKTAVRKKLPAEEVKENLREYQKQASKFISFSGPNKALLKFNSEWLSKMTFSELLEISSFVTVDQMLKREMFATRQREGRPIYMHEFLYPIMQGYDSVAMDVDGEIGGNDQTFNMLIGRDFLKTFKNKEKFVVATKLLIDPSGKKMGKTEGNMVSLGQSPEDMFGRVMSWDDELIVPGFEIITNVSLSEIESIKNSLNAGENPKNFKMKLAEKIVDLCHGQGMGEKAKNHFEKTFSQGETPDDVLEVSATKETLLSDILLAEKLVSSKTEWRRLVSEGAVTDIQTGQKVGDIEEKVSPTTYRIGKKRFIKIKI